MRLEEMPSLLFEAGEIGLADLSNSCSTPSPISSAKFE
jgi:hypothetical protein